MVEMVMIATIMVLIYRWGDGSEDDIGADMVWEGFYTSDSWNQPVTYIHIQFSTNIANVRRAPFLCDQPDTFHTIRITKGGIKSV